MFVLGRGDKGAKNLDFNGKWKLENPVHYSNYSPALMLQFDVTLKCGYIRTP
jgi:hypothetical protein